MEEITFHLVASVGPAATAAAGLVVGEVPEEPGETVRSEDSEEEPASEEAMVPGAPGVAKAAAVAKAAVMANEGLSLIHI